MSVVIKPEGVEFSEGKTKKENKPLPHECLQVSAWIAVL